MEKLSKKLGWKKGQKRQTERARAAAGQIVLDFDIDMVRKKLPPAPFLYRDTETSR